MSVPVNFRPPAVQPSSVVNAGRSLASLQALAAATVHYMGWRARRLTNCIVAWGDASYLNLSGGVTATHHVRLRTAPNCTHLFVAFIYQARDDESGGSQIELELYTVAGVSKDGPVVFDSTLGTLRTQSSDFGIISDGESPFLTAHTGVIENPPIVERPRLLVVPSDTRDVDCDLRITTVNCRLRGVTVWELPTGTIS